MWNWIKTLVKTPYQECYAKSPYKVGQYCQNIGPCATLHAIFDPMTYGLKRDLKSYMILGSNKSWAELDYTVINLLKFLFQNCLNNFLILWWLLFSQLVLMIIAIFHCVKNANLPTGKSIVHNAAHSFMDYVNI